MSNAKTIFVSRNRQRGAELIEFAFVLIIFLVLLVGIMEFGRWVFTLNAASEATRWGARLAVVCGKNDDIIKKQMKKILRSLKDDEISINYFPEACSTPDCLVTVSLNNAKHTILILKPKIDTPKDKPLTELDTSIFGKEITLPTFSTTLPRESLDSADSAPGKNEICNE
jgi:hypothetical protein